MKKFEAIREDFEKAVGRLEEVLQLEKTDVVRDSAIKRFELVFDMGWKTLKALLEEKHAVSCQSPRICFQEAFRVGVIAYDEFWISVTGARNYTAHAYREAFAEKIYAGLPSILQKFQELRAILRGQTL